MKRLNPFLTVCASLLTGLSVITTNADTLQGALDCDAFSFTTGGDAEWFSQSSRCKVGDTALRSGAIGDGEVSYVETTVNGGGGLSFWWDVSSEDSDYDYLLVTVDGVEQSRIGGVIEEWTKHTLFVPEGRHTVRWTYCKDSSVDDGEDCAWLDGVTWTPAPEKISVRYVVNRGPALAGGEFTPGATVSDLATPEGAEDGYSFAGWYLDEDLMQELTGYLPMEENLTVYAKWILPVSALQVEGLALSSDGNGAWQAMKCGDQGNEYCLRYDSRDGNDSLAIEATGHGTVSFDMELGDFQLDGYVEISDWIEEYDEEDAEDYGYYETERTIYTFEMGSSYDLQLVGTGRHRILIRFYSSGAFGPAEADEVGPVLIKNLTWTPAPTQMTVHYNVNGGQTVPDGTFVPGATWGELPSAAYAGHAFVFWAEGSTNEFGVLTGKVDRTEYLPFKEDITVTARWGVPLSALDCDLALRNEGDDTWFAEEDLGGMVVRAEVSRSLDEGACSDVSSGNLAVLATTVVGYGTLSFRSRETRLNGWSWGELSCLVDNQFQVVGLDWGGNWSDADMLVYGEGEHEVKWIASCASSDLTRIDLSDICWTPAPATMTVRFDSDGGTTVEPREFRPGDAYGALPIPAKEGWTFAGWHEGEQLGRPANEWDYVPFADVTLVAKWIRPVSNMTDSGLTFATDEAYGFFQSNVRTSSGAFAAEANPTNALLTYVWNEEGRVVLTNALPTLTTTVAGPGYLSFAWKVRAAENGFYGCVSFSIDGEEKAMSETTEWQSVKAYIEEGTHVLCWQAQGSDGPCGDPVSLLDYPQSTLVGEVRFEPKAPQETMGAWHEKFSGYGVWSTGDLPRFASQYASRIEANAQDYEARICHAVAILGGLAENAEFVEFAQRFGFAIDYAHCAFVGEPKLDADTPGLNEMVDRAIAVAVPVIQSALSDLEAVPADWSGSVRLSSDEWPFDTDVYVDRADTLFARASLDAALGMIYFLGGYDLVADWQKFADATASSNGHVRAQTILSEQTGLFMAVRHADRIRSSGASVRAALTHALEADAAVLVRQDADTHVVEYDEEDFERLELSRTTLRSALLSLDDPQAFDLPALLEKTAWLNECDFSLLPGAGIMRVYLGALFSGTITRDMLPETSIAEDGELSVMVSSMTDPIFAGLFPEMTKAYWLAFLGHKAKDVPPMPTIEGDAGATVTGDVETGFVVRPSEGKSAVEVTIPAGIDVGRVTVEVPVKVKSVKPHGAKVKVVRGDADITEFLNLPMMDGGGAIDLSMATVKEEYVKEAMDPEKGAEIVLDAANPKMITPNTRKGLFYQLREGTTIDGMTDGDSCIGDGKPWKPDIKVKGGKSAFYAIGVGKGE